MRTRTLALWLVLLALALIWPGGLAPTVAQAPGPLAKMPVSEGGEREAPGILPEDTGGPDDYGYTWDDGEPFAWIDATGGTDLGLSGDDVYSGAIDIGFDFPFYEHVYSQLYVNANGLVTFGSGTYHYSNTVLPELTLPNNLLTPFWDDLCVNYGGYNTGAIYTLLSGIAPNRTFTIEWHEISKLGYSDLLTFEVVLHEDGDVVMQYLSLTGNLSSATVGIEDDQGLDGLTYLYNVGGLVDGLAVRMVRPGPAVRVKTWPPNQGKFGAPGGEIKMAFQVRNNGGLGADTYDLLEDSVWPLSFEEDDGTPLIDTDGDSLVDTGPLAEGGTMTVVAVIDVPGNAAVADQNPVQVTVRSSLDTAVSKEVDLQMAVPAPFGQILLDGINGALSIDLVQPGGEMVKKVSVDWRYGFDLSVAETPRGFVAAWVLSRYNGTVYVNEIETAILDREGEVARGLERLADHSGATMTTYDYDPALAVAPNGTIGVAWYREIYDDVLYAYNRNVYVALLDRSGELAFGPLNLTENDAWGNWSDEGVPFFDNPRIVATDDGRFVVAWSEQVMEPAGVVNDIYFAVRDTTGAEVVPVTALTADTPGWDQGYGQPALAALDGGKALVVYQSSWESDIFYSVINTSGTTIKPKTDLTGGQAGYSYYPDAVQLSGGKSLVAWTVELWPEYKVYYAMLDGNYDPLSGPTLLDNPVALTGDNYVSVAADREDHGILTWMDAAWNNQRNLYYALAGSNGSLLTEPMIFYTSEAASPNVTTSLEGYGNTSYFLPQAEQYLPLVMR